MNRNHETTIVLADDHPVIRQAVRQALESVPSLRVVAEADSGGKLEDIIREHRPHLLILDLEMEPAFDPVRAIELLREIHPKLKVIIFSVHNESHTVMKMMATKANGYAYKGEPLTELLAAIRAVANGATWYSPGLLQDLATEYWQDPEVMLEEHERLVLQHIADGMAVRAIAARLLVSERSVHHYLSTAMQKLDAQTRTQAVAKALRRRLIE